MKRKLQNLAEKMIDLSVPLTLVSIIGFIVLLSYDSGLAPYTLFMPLVLLLLSLAILLIVLVLELAEAYRGDSL